MLFQKISIILMLLSVSIISLPMYKINLQDKKIFEIASDNKDYDEQNENEMIQPVDLATMEVYPEDESRYKPLHSLIENYNKRDIVNKIQLANVLTQMQPIVWENSNTIEKNDKPFIAGFKEDLDKVLQQIKNQNFYKKIFWTKRENEQHLYQTPPKENEDFFQINTIDLSLWETTKTTPNGNSYKKDSTFRPQEHTSVNIEAFTVNVGETELGEEIYDYEKFKREYEEQIAQYTTIGKILNYTNKVQLEEMSRRKYQKLFDFENCKEVSRKIGIKAIDCLIYNYKHEKPAVKKSIQKVWLIIRVWFLIYVCLAIPCWCHKGWCCCCFRCKFCFPRKRILFAKQYYAINPPGRLAKEFQKKKDIQQFITYEPTEFEEDAFEQFEAAIRNI